MISRSTGLVALLLAVAVGAVALVVWNSGQRSDSQTTTAAVAASEADSATARGDDAGATGSATDAGAAEIYQRAAPGVVTITSTTGGAGGQDVAQGSGFVVSEDGAIITNAHVVGESANGLGEADQVYVQFSDRNQVSAEVVGTDPFSDIAVLEVDPQGLDLQPLELGSEDDVVVGEAVLAIGSPFGQEQSLSTGVISATDRSIESLTDYQIDGALQTDASINPGNSGGPLIDSDGQVIGVNQQINSTSGGNEGVGYAVPIDLAERSLAELLEDGEAEYAYLGVGVQPLYPQLAEQLGIEAETGALLSEVVAGGPAAEAGLRGGDRRIRFQGREVDAGGDVITAVDGEPIVGETDLPELISTRDPGETVTLDVISDGEPEQVELVLEERPASA